MSETVNLNISESVIAKADANEEWTAIYTLYKDIQNMSEIREKLIKGEVEAALINPCLIVDLFQVTVAVNKAIRAKLFDKLKTRNIFTEIIFNLSPDRKIAQALQNFGVDEKGNSLLAVRVVTEIQNGSEEEYSPLNGIINGIVTPLKDLKMFTNVEKLKKVYKLTEEEFKHGSLIDSVVGRMAVKDVL